VGGQLIDGEQADGQRVASSKPEEGSQQRVVEWAGTREERKER
jgi:hypothetical protein